MTAVYNILCMLLCMVPMLSFITSAVVMAMYDHPYFATVFAVFAVLTTPKLSLDSSSCNDKKDKGNNK